MQFQSLSWLAERTTVCVRSEYHTHFQDTTVMPSDHAFRELRSTWVAGLVKYESYVPIKTATMPSAKTFEN
jgi:hypothetical protein